uniref:Nucleolar protein 16 n=1 Tax=Petromyzon marinus TaxID=7757 RepID=A0AAJ7SL06_PETMA|nr:nucleolar protein 16 isoform X4 [Petromyzon marinus]
MPKARTRRKNRFQFGLNRRNAAKRNKRRENPRIECDVVRAAWDGRRSARRNLEDMGLASDPNQSVPLRMRRRDLKEPATKPHVAQALEQEAAVPVTPSPPSVSNDIVLMVRRLVHAYGEDYKAMARDDNNHYQDTPSQIRRKVELVRRHCPQEWELIISSSTGSSTDSSTDITTDHSTVIATDHSTEHSTDHSSSDSTH